MVTATLILIVAVLTGSGIFHNFADIAGAGAFVPITGFANAMISPALEFKTEGLIAGTASKMFSIAGPVVIYGIVASIAAGILFAIFNLI